MSGHVVNKLVSSGSYGVYLLQGCDAIQRRTYHYIMVHKHKVSGFLRALQSGNADISVYGNIIASGYGFAPPAHIQNEILNRFGARA